MEFNMTTFKIKNMTFSKLGLLIVAVGLFSVSVYSEVMLFTSVFQANAEKLLAGTFAFFVVLAQIVFADQAAFWRSRKNDLLAGLCGLAVLVLMIVSVAGSVFFFESGFNEMKQKQNTSGTGYQLAVELINSKQNTIAGLKANAEKSEQAGNAWDAGQKRLAAVEVENELAALILSLADNKAEAVGSASAMVGILESYRFIAWFIFAAIADFVPVLAVVLLRLCPVKETKQETKQTNETKQPVKQNENKTETKQSVKTTAKPTAKNKQTLREIIAQGKSVPSVREAKELGFSYAAFKAEIETLVEDNFLIKRESGKGWEVA
tara:strand:+ start:3272 stop:4234 length:963 start_codon:yes stop_codon:yes gene_type:complete